jgi:phosphoribosylformylglycinamidine synthase
LPEWETFRVEVCPCETQGDAQAAWIKAIHQLGFVPVESCVATRLFYLQGALSQDQARDLAHSLLADPVTEQFRVEPGVVEGSLDEGTHSIEVTLLPGVTDPVAESLVNAAHLLGYPALERAATGQRYLLRGSLTPLAQIIWRRSVLELVIQRAGGSAHPTTVCASPGSGLYGKSSSRAADDTHLQAIASRLALFRRNAGHPGYYQREIMTPPIWFEMSPRRGASTKSTRPPPPFTTLPRCTH